MKPLLIIFLSILLSFISLYLTATYIPKWLTPQFLIIIVAFFIGYVNEKESNEKVESGFAAVSTYTLVSVLFLGIQVILKS